MSYTNPGYTTTTPPASDLGALAEGDPGKDKKKKEKKTTKGVVDRQILIAGLFALLVAAAAVLIYTSATKGTYAVIAKNPINAGTVLNVDMVTAVKTPDDLLVSGAITGNSEQDALTKAKDTFTGQAVTNQIIPQNGQLSTSTFGPGLALSTQLPAGQRLVSVAAKVSRAAGGKLKPGDKVDVVATVDGRTGVIARNATIVSYTVSQDQFDQAANQQSGSDKNAKPDNLLPGEPIPGIYVLAVPTAEAVKVNAARETGEVNLLYLGPNADPAPATVYSSGNIFGQ